MRSVLIWITVIVLAAGLGLAAAAGVGALMRRATPSPLAWGSAGPGFGMMGGYGQGRGSSTPSGQRLSMDQAVQLAKTYAANSGTNLEVAEVMEFAGNFYAAIRESDSGRGAFEILIDPYSGAAYPEPGPNMMWNLKYGHMRRWTADDNTLNLEQARALAQQALEADLPGAQVHKDGLAFYGYYTFDYDVNGQIAGMLSVNGFTGDVWPHTWHGQFIAEKELER